MALKVGELFASFNLDTSGLNGAVSDAKKSLDDLGKGMQMSGAAMTATVTAPIVKAARDVYKAGTDFGAQMSEVFAIANVADDAEAMEMLRAKALEMGSTTAFTATEAAEAFKYMGMAGWRAEQMVEGIGPILNLAAASGEELGTVSDIVTDALTAFGLSANDAEHFADVLAATATSANTNVGLMGESFKYVAPLAGSLGFSIDDVAQALGLMANAGIKGSMAGTSLRNVLQNMIDPTGPQATALEKLGLSLYDANGAVKDLGTIMGDFRRVARESGVDMHELRARVAQLDEQLEAGNITEEEYNRQIAAMADGGDVFLECITKIAGSRGLSGLLAIMNASEDDFNNLGAAINGSAGAAERMKNIMLDNAKGDVTLFQSAVEGLEISLWGLADDGFRKVVQQATGLVNAFAGLSDETKLGTVKWLGMAAALGPVLVNLGTLVRFVPKLGRIFTVLNSPLALLALGLFAVGAAAIDANNTMGKTLEKALPALGDKVASLGKKVKKQFPQLAKNTNHFLQSLRKSITRGLPGLIDGAADILTTVIQTLRVNMKDVGTVMGTLITEIGAGLRRNLPQLIPAVVYLIKNMGIAMIRNIPVILRSLGEIVQGIIEGLRAVDWKATGGEIWREIKSAFRETGDWIKEIVLGDGYSPDASWGDVWDKIWDAIKRGAGNLGDWLAQILLGEEGYNPEAGGWAQIWNSLWDIIKRGASELGDWLAEILLKDEYDPANSGWSQIWAKVWTAIKKGVGALGDWLSELLLRAEYSASDEGWSTIWDKVWTAIRNGATNVGDWLAKILLRTDYNPNNSGWGQLWGKVWEAIKRGVGNLGDWLSKILLQREYSASNGKWSGIWSKMWDAIKKGVGALGDWLAQIVLGDEYAATDNKWGGIWNKIWGAITAGFDRATDWLAGVLGIESFEAGSAYNTVGERVWNAIKDGFHIVTGWLADLLFPKGEDGEITTLGDNWADAVAGIARKLTESLTHAHIMEFLTGFINGIVNTLSGKDTEGQNNQAIADSVSGLFRGILDGILAGLTSAVSAAGDLAVAILNMIGQIFTPENITAAFNTVGNIITAAGEEGSLIDVFTTVLDNILVALGNLIREENIDAVVTGVNNLLNAILNQVIDLISSGKVTELLNTIIDTIGSVLSGLASNSDEIFNGAISLARGIMDAIAAGIRQLPSIATTLFDAMSEVLDGLMQALANIDAGQAGRDAAEGVIGIYDALYEASGDQEMSNSFAGFAGKLGTALGDAIQFACQFAAGFIGRLGDYLVNEDGLRKIFIAAWNIGKMILRGIWEAVKGLATSLGNWLGGVFEGVWNSVANWFVNAYWDVVDVIKPILDLIGVQVGERPTFEVGVEPVITAPDEASRMVNETIAALYENPTAEEAAKAGLRLFANFGSRAGDLIKENLIGRGLDETAATNIMTGLAGAYDKIWEAAANGNGEGIRTGLERIGLSISDEMIQELLGINYSERGERAEKAFNEIIREVLRASSTRETVAEETEGAVSDGLAEGFAGAVDSGEAQAAFERAMEGVEINPVAEAELAMTLTDGMSASEQAAAEVSDAVVTEYLKRMNRENAAAIANEWLAGLQETLVNDETVQTAAGTLGEHAKAAADAKLSKNTGFRIGLNFAEGIANGIRYGIISVTRAVNELGSRAVNALEGNLQINSPSKVTQEIGGFFDKGFAAGLLGNAGLAGRAAEVIGSEATNALRASYTRVADAVSDEMGLTGRPHSAQSTAAQEQARVTAIDQARIIAGALNGARVVLDGETTGHLIVPYVSGEIAFAAAGRRHGTE